MIRKFSGETIGLQTFLLHCFGKSLSIQPSTVSASVEFSSWLQCRIHLQEGFNGGSASKQSTCNAVKFDSDRWIKLRCPQEVDYEDKLTQC